MTSIAQISENEQMEITGTLKKSFGKNTVYRFLNSVKTNWERLTCMLSARIINRSIRKLTGEDRQDVSACTTVEGFLIIFEAWFL